MCIKKVLGQAFSQNVLTYVEHANRILFENNENVEKFSFFSASCELNEKSVTKEVMTGIYVSYAF